jgi:MFS family permease
MAETTERLIPAPPPWREVFEGARGRLTAGLLLLEAIVAIEWLIVATVMPAVEEDLGGLGLYGWAFTAVTLASLGTVPIAGRVTDRLGPRKVLAAAAILYVTGLSLAALAPSMLILVVARFVQGVGGGGLYVVSLATVAKTYPERIRPRVMALLASMWILPGLVGPLFGGWIADAFGWRWAFAAPVPLIALGAVIVLPSMRSVEGMPDEEGLPVAPSLQLMLGAGLFLAGLTEIAWSTVLLVPAGLVFGMPALRRITPPGTFVARPGLPAAAAAAFLASMAFVAMDAFLTLMLVNVRGLSLTAAGLIITGAALMWAFGSWLQSRIVQRVGARWLTAFGASMIAVATVLVSTGLVASMPLAIAYVGWGFAGFGMGIVFPTIPLSVMAVADEGHEAGELSSTILMDFLGVGIGAGLGGASVALADAGLISLEAGIAGAFGLALVTAVALALVARRIPDARHVDSAA